MTDAELDALVARLQAPCIGNGMILRNPDGPKAVAALTTLRKQSDELRRAMERIVGHGDPWEIMEEPEDFGGTDDGAETVCMVYENMQSIARQALSNMEGE